MKLLFLDTETEGLEKHHKPVEIGYSLVDSDYNYTILKQGSFLLPGIPHKITGIPKECTVMLPSAILEHSIKDFMMCVSICDCTVAHNINFDLRMLKKIIALPEKPAFCFCNDINWNQLGCTSKKLVNVAKKLGVPELNAHTALSDVIMMIECAKNIQDAFFLDLVRLRCTFNNKEPELVINSVQEKPVKEKSVLTKKNFKFVFRYASEENIQKYNLEQEGEVFVYYLKDATKDDVFEFISKDNFFRPPNCSFASY